MTKQRLIAPARRNPRVRTLSSLALLALAVVAFASGAPATSAPAAPELPAVQEALAGLAVPFEQNTGQFAPEVAYLAKTFAGAVFVTRDGRLVYSLPGKAIEAKTDDVATETRLARRQRASKRGPGWVLEERLLDARPLAPQGTTPAVTHVTRFTPKGTFQADTWQGVGIGEAWAGIEVELAARGRNFEKLFHVAPGADPEAIRIGLRGAEGAHVAADGRLIVATGNGEIAYTAPVAWQEIVGARQTVEVRYVLLAPEADADEAAYGFVLGAYDRHHPLTIDPLIQSTYLGGSGEEIVKALALAANGDVLVGGYTSSTDLPSTAGGAQSAYGGGDYDGFVARLSGNLRTLLQSSYLGGSGWDQINALALAANGDVLVGGMTQSTDLPGTAGGAQPIYGGSTWDGFVVRLTGDLRTRIQSTYLGGRGGEEVNALTLATNGDVLVGGRTSSSDLPGTAGSAQPTYGGGYDGFVARLAGDLTSLRQSTYLGGSGYDYVYALALAANGDVLVGGNLQSIDLPGTAGGAQPTYGGGSWDGFVARLSGNLTSLQQSTYLGGNDYDHVRSLALAANGDVLAGGQTHSTDLPGTAGGAQPSKGGGSDGFVARLAGNLKTRIQSTYMGGNWTDAIWALVVAANGDVLVGGETGSTSLPGSAGGAQPDFSGYSDGFVARLSGDLTHLQQSTFLGGSGSDHGLSLALAVNGDVLVGGYTDSTDLPGRAGGAQASNRGGRDGFVARLSGDLRAESPVTPSEPCVPSATKLCLNGGRFHVTVRWRDYTGTRGDGQAVTETDDSGLFWFFNADNLEMLVKVLDGCTINDHFWVFAAATTDVEYELTVRDATTGTSRTYQNPLGVASPAITDTSALAVCSDTDSRNLPGTAGGAQPAYGGGDDDDFIARLADDPWAESPVLLSEPCVPSATKLCLNGGRFHVTVRWRDYTGTRGAGQAVTETDDSGLFWFFNADNLEMLVKVLDGCWLTGHYWVFAAATTDVEYELTVRDAITGESRTYQNPLGVASPAITDTDALAVCP